MSDANNLAEASVLGRDFIENHLTGSIKECVKIVDGERVYELLVAGDWSDEIPPNNLGVMQARYVTTGDVKVLISEVMGQKPS